MQKDNISRDSIGVSAGETSSGKTYSWIVLLGTLIVYILTCCRTIYVGDSGELTLALSTGGIAHPPGYPLYTILGYVWLKLFSFLRPALGANLFSAAAASVASVLLFKLLEKIGRGNIPSNINAALAFVFAFSFTIWSAATAAEVYALSALLYIAALYFIVDYFRTGERRPFFAAAFFCGLIMTHHFSAIVVAISLPAAMIARKQWPNFRTILSAVIAFILPLSLYIYLLLRFDPTLPVNWMSEQSMTALWKLFSGENYQQFVAISTFGDFFLFIRKTFSQWFIDFGPALMLLALPGLFFGLRRNFRLTIIMVLPAALNLFMVSCYQIPDYGGYLIPAIITIIILISICLTSCWKYVSHKSWLTVLVILCLIALSIATNFPRCDISKFTLAERYGRDLLDSTPENAILLLKSDNGSHPALYLHYLENHRPDIELYSSYSTLTRFMQKYTMSAFLNPGWMGPPGRRVFRGMEYLILPDLPMDPPIRVRQGFVYGSLYSNQDNGREYEFHRPSTDSTMDRSIEGFVLDTLPIIQFPDDYKAAQVAMEYQLLLLDIYGGSGNEQGMQRVWDDLNKIVEQTSDPQTALTVVRYCKIRPWFSQIPLLKLAESFDPPGYIRKDILINWASYYRSIGDLSKAAEVLRQALSIDPDFNTARYNLNLVEAHIATQAGNWAAAIDAYEILHQLDNQNPLPLYNIAILMERMPGRAMDALNYYRRFLQATEISSTQDFANAVAGAKQRIEVLETLDDSINAQPPYNPKLK
ncbi:MAG: DUF2723 domain-containing protein [FCB group bacterium]|nr:DUF2723 domain-containing protein [FCB group bacterium]